MFAKNFKKLDLFGTGIGFNIEGEGTHQTFVGAFFSLITFFFSIIYGVQRFTTMYDYGDTVFQNRLKTRALDETIDFTSVDMAVKPYFIIASPPQLERLVKQFIYLEVAEINQIGNGKTGEKGNSNQSDKLLELEDCTEEMMSIVDGMDQYSSLKITA